MKWGILSTGTIAKNFAQTAKQMPDVQVQAVASRSAGSAEAFAETFAIPTAHDSYEALANDPNVDIVYVATPHSCSSVRASMSSAKRASPPTRSRRRKSSRWRRKRTSL